MNSDSEVTQVDAEKTANKDSSDTGAFRSGNNAPRDQSNSAPSTAQVIEQQAAAKNSQPQSHEAELRQIIRLQRLALTRQNQRIQLQRSKIVKLKQALLESCKQPVKPQRENISWLRSLLRSKNS